MPSHLGHVAGLTRDAQSRMNTWEKRPHAETKHPMYVLEAMNGPLDGKRWEFESNIVIGRDARSAQAALPVDRAVSRRHARIDADGRELAIIDLGSSNGTVVHGEPIAGTVALQLREPFIVGRTMLRVLDAAADSADIQNG